MTLGQSSSKWFSGSMLSWSTRTISIRPEAINCKPNREACKLAWLCRPSATIRSSQHGCAELLLRFGQASMQITEAAA
jgi:hypothetical protein